MDARIAALSGHVVVCGHGRVGASAAESLHAGGQRLVVVMHDDNLDWRVQQLSVGAGSALAGRGRTRPSSRTPGAT